MISRPAGSETRVVTLAPSGDVDLFNSMFVGNDFTAHHRNGKYYNIGKLKLYLYNMYILIYAHIIIISLVN